MLIRLRREMAERPVRGSGPPSNPVTKRAQAIVALAATVAFSVPLVLKAGADGTGVGVVLAIVSLTTLTLALGRVIRAARQDSTFRTAFGLLSGLTLWSAFMLALMTVAPGAPLAHGEITHSGTVIPLEAGAAGRRMTLLIKGRIPDASTEAIHVAVTAATVEIRGSLSRTHRRVRIAGRVERTTEPDAIFARALDVPPEATRLTVTSINGPLDRPLVVDLYPTHGGPAVAVIVFSVLALLMIGAETLFHMPGYSGATVAGLGASLVVTGTAPPEWRLESAIMGVAFGTICGLFVGLAGAHVFRRLRPHAANKEGLARRCSERR